MSTPKSPNALGGVLTPKQDWLLRQVHEEIIAPALPIIDPHHHLWDRPHHRYMLPELVADTGSGHRVIATVFVDCVAFYRKDGDPALRPVGETEFANGVAAMAASGVYGPTLACAGIISHANLSLGAGVREVLEAHLQAAPARFRGIRHAGGWDASPMINNSHTQPPQGLYGDVRWREGFAQLAPLGLSFEAWQYHPQLPEVIDLARAFPETAIILNHCGGPLGIGPYEGRSDETFAQWKAHMRTLSACPNVTVKLGGLGMRLGVFRHFDQAVPPTSAQIAQDWRPWIETSIEAFGAQRCMFESNFPVDKLSSGYAVLWNAFKRLAAGASAQDTEALFSGTAARVYRLQV